MSSPNLRIVKGELVKTDNNALYIERFLKFKKTKKKKTCEFYQHCLKTYHNFATQNWPPTPDLINEFIVSSQKAGAADNTVHADYRAIRTWCRWLVKIGALDQNPIILVDAPSQPKRKIPRAPRDEVLNVLFEFLEERVEKAIREKQLVRYWLWSRDLAVYSLIFGTGLRISEAANLELADLDLGKNTVFVRESKNNEQRTVPMGKIAKGDLSLWLRVRSDLPIGDTKKLFISKHQFEPFTHWGIRQRLIALCRVTNIERFTPHCLRHAYAGYSLKNGANLEDLRENMGHADLKTTSIYTLMHLDERIERSVRVSPRSTPKQVENEKDVLHSPR